MVTAVAALLCFVVPTFSQQSYPVWYDNLYDQKGASIDTVECSNFLVVHGFADKTLGDLPTYPFIGGAPQIQSQDSPNCGSCWEFSYVTANGDNVLVDVLAINSGKNNPDGFTTSFNALNMITGGIAQSTDGQPMTVSSRTIDYCGL